MIHRDVFLQEWDLDLQFCLFPDFTVVCVWLQTTSLSNWIQYKRGFFRLWKAHVFKSYKKGWKWRYYEVKTLSSLFLYFKRIMVDCYRAINQSIKFGNIWEICVCPQTLETLEMRLFAKRTPLTATKRGGYRRNLLSGPSLLGSSYEGFCQRKIGIELICLVMQRMTVFVCL